VLADALPQLRRVKLQGAADLDDVRHPALEELELCCTDATALATTTARGVQRSLVDRVGAPAGSKLPAMSRLILRIDRGLDAVVSALARDLVAGLRALVVRGDLSGAGLDALQAAGARLEELDVRGTRVARGDGRLAKLGTRVIVDEPAAPPPAPERKPLAAWLVRHARPARLGHGPRRRGDRGRSAGRIRARGTEARAQCRAARGHRAERRQPDVKDHKVVEPAGPTKGFGC
jgi:hypothetical protein